MTHYFNELAIESKEILPGVFLQILSGRGENEKIMLVRYFIKAGAIFPRHSHLHEQHGFMMEGEAEFEIGGERSIVSAGQGYIIPGGVGHGAVFNKDSIVLDIFSPPRDDFFVIGDIVMENPG